MNNDITLDKIKNLTIRKGDFQFAVNNTGVKAFDKKTLDYIDFNENNSFVYDDSLAMTLLITPASSKLRLLVMIYSMLYYREASYGSIYNGLYHLLVYGSSNDILDNHNNGTSNVKATLNKVIDDILSSFDDFKENFKTYNYDVKFINQNKGVKKYKFINENEPEVNETLTNQCIRSVEEYFQLDSIRNNEHDIIQMLKFLVVDCSDVFERFDFHIEDITDKEEYYKGTKDEIKAKFDENTIQSAITTFATKFIAPILLKLMDEIFDINSSLKLRTSKVRGEFENIIYNISLENKSESYKRKYLKLRITLYIITCFCVNKVPEPEFPENYLNLKNLNEFIWLVYKPLYIELEEYFDWHDNEIRSENKLKELFDSFIFTNEVKEKQKKIYNEFKNKYNDELIPLIGFISDPEFMIDKFIDKLDEYINRKNEYPYLELYLDAIEYAKNENIPKEDIYAYAKDEENSNINLYNQMSFYDLDNKYECVINIKNDNKFVFNKLDSNIQFLIFIDRYFGSQNKEQDITKTNMFTYLNKLLKEVEQRISSLLDEKYKLSIEILIPTENVKMSVARNILMQYAKTMWITFNDDDDLSRSLAGTINMIHAFKSNYLFNPEKYLLKDGNNNPINYINESGHEIVKAYPLRLLGFRTTERRLGMWGYLWNRISYIRLGYYNSVYFTWAEDVEMIFYQVYIDSRVDQHPFISFNMRYTGKSHKDRDIFLSSEYYYAPPSRRYTTESNNSSDVFFTPMNRTDETIFETDLEKAINMVESRFDKYLSEDFNIKRSVYHTQWMEDNELTINNGLNFRLPNHTFINILPKRLLTESVVKYWYKHNKFSPEFIEKNKTKVDFKHPDSITTVDVYSFDRERMTDLGQESFFNTIRQLRKSYITSDIDSVDRSKYDITPVDKWNEKLDFNRLYGNGKKGFNIKGFIIWFIAIVIVMTIIIALIFSLVNEPINTPMILYNVN